MKRKYKMISIVIGFVLIIGILVFGMSQWNKQIDETAEQAKEDLNSTEQAKEDDLNVAEQTKDDSNLNGKSSTSVGDDSKEEDLSTGEKKQSESVPKPSESGELDSAADSTSADRNGTAKGDGNSGFQDVAVNLPSNTDPSLTEIKTTYRTAFSDLEVQQTSQMDQLLLQAKADYVSGKLSKINLALKYQDALTTLESNTDQLFNTIYQQMENDLEKNGYSANEATEFRSDYQAKKQERQSHVMNQLQNF